MAIDVVVLVVVLGVTVDEAVGIADDDDENDDALVLAVLPNSCGCGEKTTAAEPKEWSHSNGIASSRKSW